MSMIYSHCMGTYIDTDKTEVVELSNGDVVAMDDDFGLLEAYERDLLTDEQMLELGFTIDDLGVSGDPTEEEEI